MSLAADVLDGDHAALGRAITVIEERAEGHRDLVSELYGHAGSADIVGVTGAPGAGKSTLVDKLARAYRDRGDTVGVIAIDPASPFTGGAVLGDRIRMASNAGDMDVFFRSMSARGTLGGLAAATADAVNALDAFGKDVVIVETVGAGQNEIDVVRTADTVAVLVPPGSGDAVQMLKAGILEIGDAFVVNKADLEGADRLVRDLREMIELGDGPGGSRPGGLGGQSGDDETSGEATWEPRIVETVATDGEGVGELLSVLDEHAAFLDETGLREREARSRIAEQVRTLLREDLAGLVEEEMAVRGGLSRLVDRASARETDPYSIADELLAPVEECLAERRSEAEEAR